MSHKRLRRSFETPRFARLLRMTARYLAVIPGRAAWREPGIQSSARCWIPGLRPRGRIPE
jgi:hypothetical protein